MGEVMDRFTARVAHSLDDYLLSEDDGLIARFYDDLRAQSKGNPNISDTGHVVIPPSRSSRKRPWHATKWPEKHAAVRNLSVLLRLRSFCVRACSVIAFMFSFCAFAFPAPR